MRKGDGALLVDMMLVDAQLDAVPAEKEAKTEPAKKSAKKTSAAKA